jgi:hypothetical protein
LRRDPYSRVRFEKADGRSCAGCALAIGRDEVEVDVDFSDGAILRLHSRCFDFWSVETQRPVPPLR